MDSQWLTQTRLIRDEIAAIRDQVRRLGEGMDDLKAGVRSTQDAVMDFAAAVRRLDLRFSRIERKLGIEP